MKMGQPVTLGPPIPGDPFQGKVTQIRNSPVITQNVVTYVVVVGVDNRS